MNKKVYDKDNQTLFQYIFCIISYLSALVFIKLKVPFTSSGEVTFYFVEIVGLLLWLYILIYFIKNYKKISKNNKIIFGTVFVSQTVFVMIYVIRALLGNFEMKSILILESNLFVLSFLILVIFQIISTKVVLSSLSVFLAILGIFSVISIFVLPDCYTDFVLYHSEQFYLLSFGNAIRTYIMLITLPISALNFYMRSDKVSKICFYLQLISTIVCGMISGARVNYLCIPFAIMVICIIFVKNNRIKRWDIPKNIIITSVLAIVAVFLVSPFSMRVYSQMTRLDVTKNVMETFNIPFIGIQDNSGKDETTSNEIDNESSTNNQLQGYLDSANESAEQSTSSRVHMWELALEDIKKAPLFGKGLTQYEFTFSNGVSLPMQAHNFVLEYLLGFGIIGFIFWGIMIFTPEWLVLKKIKFQFWNHAPICFTICTLLLASGGAFFQPYFLYPCNMFFIFIMMGCFYNISMHVES